MAILDNEEEQKKKGFEVVKNTPVNNRTIDPEFKKLFHVVKNVDKIIKEPKEEKQEENKILDESIFCNFTEKEISNMPKEFIPSFKVGKIKASIRLRENVYEIRSTINGHNLSASSKNLAIAKEKFLILLKTTDTTKRPKLTIRTYTRKKKKLGEYLINWLETVKRPYIKESTYNFYKHTIYTHILPYFKDKNIEDIKQLELQTFINKYTNDNKLRTAQKIHLILSSIFEYAVQDDIITKSPMKKVIYQSYDSKKGTALTREEEKQLISKIQEKDTLYNQAYLLMLYTGIRRSELATLEKKDKWIIVTTSKQRKGKNEKIRKIPISPMLMKYIENIDIEKIKKLNTAELSRNFKLLMNNHHLHELRHTFITRCQECNIQREIVSLWAGHSADNSITSIIYTHLEQYEENQLKEILKFDY